jgi:ribulose-5-phosphate 4-epimerase/fuculose-1-phosphate aldolase
MSGSADEFLPANFQFSPPQPDPNIILDLVAANHILFDQGVVDAFGHVSARHDKRPDRFFLARNIAPGQVKAEDILEFTMDGEPVSAMGRAVYLERFIHSELYRSRSDVNAIVHSHSHSIIPLTISKTTRLRAIFHMAGFIGNEAPLFEIRQQAGPATDLLISSAKLGLALADCCGQSNIVLMRGHGSTVVAHSIPEAVYRAIYAELNARYQCQAMALGDVEYLTAEEGAACIQNVEAQWRRPWALWKEQAAARRTNSLNHSSADA